jgi:hypothetical protein
MQMEKKETTKISEFIKSIFRKDSDEPPTRNVPPQSQPESRPQWFNQVSTSPATNPWGSQRDHTNDERPGAVRTRQAPFRRRRTAHRESTRQRGQEDVHRLHRPRLRALSSNPRVGQAPERLAVPGVCQRPRRHGDSPGGVDGSTVWLRMILNRPDASTKLAAPVFYFLGFAACFAATIARPFCFVAAALACFCAACFCVDFGDLSPICLLPPLVWQTRALNRPTFGIAPLTFAPQPCLTIN